MALVVMRSVAEWTAHFGAAAPPTVLTIGNFDGVHLGHRKILLELVERSRRTGALATAVTFDPHPLRVLRPADAPPLILTLEQRLAMLDALGLGAALVLRFTAELSRVSAEDFVREILVDGLHARLVLVGGNFRFGHRHAGDTRLLTELGRQNSFAVENIAPVEIHGTVVSSSGIRQAVRDGRMSRAGRWLGRAFSLTGAIRAGTGQGRHLVVPTLNLETGQELLPRTGVYATETSLGGREYRSVTNVGFRPTFDGRRLTIESHLFNFSQELSSGPMEVRFCTRLREEQKFPSVDALRAQVLRDIVRAQNFFRRRDRRPTRQTVQSP
jgi:riboflavin kinase/FMN adenylyltransferase